MKKTLRRVKQTLSILLAAMLAMTSLPQTGSYAFAAETVTAEDTVPSYDETGMESSDTGNTDDIGTEDSDTENTDAGNTDAENSDMGDSETDDTGAENTDTEDTGSEDSDTDHDDADDTDDDNTDAGTDDTQDSDVDNTDSENATSNASANPSSVKITSLEAETIGYTKAKIVWTVENPGNISIEDNYLLNVETGLHYAGNLDVDKDGYDIPGRYYTIITLQGKTWNVRPVLEVHNADGELTTISYEESLTVEPKDINDAEVTITPLPGTTLFQAQVQISPWYGIYIGTNSSFSDQIYIRVYSRVKGENDAWSWYSSTVSLNSGNAVVTLRGGLLPETDYEYYLELATDNYISNIFYRYGSEEDPVSFTTSGAVSYEDSQFPDEVLRSYIKERLGIAEDEKITSNKLETLSTISLYRYNTSDPAVYSLEGIQYIPSLTSLYLYNHGVTDADMISNLSGLKSINLYHNDLSSLPDLSGMANLQTANFEKNKITSGIVADKVPAAFLEKYPTWLSDTASRQSIQVRTPSQSQIKTAYNELSWSLDVTDTYSAKPSAKSPYAIGHLSDKSLNNALNLLNFVRFTAGIPSDVILDEDYIELAQAGTLVMAVNNVMTHSPARPSASDFPDDIYEKGKEGCGSSNLGSGYENVARSLAEGWLKDNDSSNIKTMGHRRWVLNPGMYATGFGYATGIGRERGFSAMYVFDRNGGAEISDFVAWPARNMPTELKFASSYPWTVSLGTDYSIPDASQVTVTMKNSSTGKTWTFNSATSDFDKNYFGINSGSYGQGACIIFRPKTSEVSYSAGARFEISISGLQDRFGNDKALQYSVEFFSLSKTQSASISLNKTTLKLAPGESETLIATTNSVDEDDMSVTWSSDDPEVATVDETGKVTAVKPGDAVITATFQGKQATCKVLVREYTLSSATLTFDLAKGTVPETLTVSDGVTTVKDVTWSSDNEAVVSVSKSGDGAIVMPKGSGTAKIQAQIKNGPVRFCSVTVANNVLRSISLNVKECTLEKGDFRQLKLYFVPNDTTLSKKVVWTSNAPETASVNDTGMITALSKGTAVITAKVGELTESCTVTVIETAAPDEDNIPSNLCALTNVQTMLSDVSLEEYEGWEWVNGDIPLTQFSGMQEKSFAAVYHKEGYADYVTTLRVSLATLTGISIITEKSSLKQENEMKASIQWKVSGSESILSTYADSLLWSSSKPDIVAVSKTEGDAGTQVILKAGSATGKATISAQIQLGVKTYKATCNISVVDKTTAEFQNLSIEGFTKTSQDGTSPACYEGMLESQTGNLRVTVSNTSKLTVKSSNAKVVSIGKVALEEGACSIPLTLKAAGMAQITLTANDAAKTTTEILLYVRDARPNLSQDTITVNKLQTTGFSFYIYPNDGYSINKCELTGDDAALFEGLEPGIKNDSYVIKTKKDTAKGSYKLSVKVEVSGTAAADPEQQPADSDQSITPFVYELPLTVKVTEQKPAYKVKQSAKANLFYKDLGIPQLIVTTEETLTGLSLTGCDFKLINQLTEEGNVYVIAPNVENDPDTESGLTTSPNKKGTLQLTFEGYEPVSVSYTVGAENKKPKLSLSNKTVNFYPNEGIVNGTTNILFGSQPLTPGSFTVELLKGSGFALISTENGLILKDGDLSKAATIKEEMKVSCDNWIEAISLPLTIKVNMGKPALKLSKTSLQLNADTTAASYDMAVTEVMWKDGAYFNPDNRLSVSAADNKSQAVIHDGIVFEQAGNRIIARTNNQSVAAGTYKFKIQVIGIPNTSATLTVKVVNADLGMAVKVSTKGSIDVLNRSGSYVTVTPSLKSVNGELTAVRLSGRFAHLFRAELDEKNKVVIYAKEKDEKGRNVALITKYPYSVNLVLTITNAKGETMHLTTAEIKLKLKQGKPKVTVTPKNAVFFSGAYNSAELTISAALKNAEDPVITKVELLNCTDVFAYSDGILTLRHTGTAVKGKAYKLQFRITFQNQADNEKTMTVNYNVKVK